MFYDTFKALCERKGVSCNKAAREIGLSNATPTQWKMRGLTPKGATLQKIADYFGVATDYLLGKEKAPAESSEHLVSDDDIKFALFGGSGEITDEMYDEVRRFAEFVRQREEQKKESK